MMVAIVMGGASPERHASLDSGRSIATAVEVLGHTAIPLVIDADGNWVDGQHEAIEILQACDVTVPALHDEGGSLQGFLQHLKIPYVGSGVAASAVGLDKHLTRSVLRAHGIAVTLPGSDLTDTEAATREVIGREMVGREMVGREIELVVLEFPDGRVETAPAPAERLRRTAVEVFEILGCAGLARVDFFVPAEGDPVVNQINTFPEFTPASHFPRMWAAAGMSYAELVDTLLRTAEARGVSVEPQDELRKQRH